MPMRRDDPPAMYERLRRAIDGESTPLALIDLDAFDRNAEALLGQARTQGKTLRVASKSVRCVEMLRRFLDRSQGAARGVMVYGAREVPFLIEQGFDDLLVAYPVALAQDARLLAAASAKGAIVTVAVDCVEHLDLLDAAANEAGTKLRVVVDVDLSLRPAGEQIHVGVRRSPLHTAHDVIGLAELATRRKHLKVVGVLAYEAHIAGVTDANPFTPAKNAVKAFVRRIAKRPVSDERAAIADEFRRAGIELSVFNGGGTGSLAWSASDPSLTEVTAGSGLLASHLFDYFREAVVEPCAYFALTVVRIPTQGFATCYGGGYVASGEIGQDRLPVPALPTGLKLTPLEGAGEVQTPLIVPPGMTLHIGDPVFFRHAKAGELSEHFVEYLLIEGDRVVGRAPTYRGMGQRF